MRNVAPAAVSARTHVLGWIIGPVVNPILEPDLAKKRADCAWIAWHVDCTAAAMTRTATILILCLALSACASPVAESNDFDAGPPGSDASAKLADAGKDAPIALLHAAEGDENRALIAVGTRGTAPAGQLWLGSTALEVLTCAVGPVLICPRRAVTANDASSVSPSRR